MQNQPKGKEDETWQDGGWGHNAYDCRSAYRGRNYPLSRGYSIGFRISCSAAPQD